MKINKLFVVAACASTLFASCSQTAADRQRQYANATLADGDAFAMIKLVGENGNYLVNLADVAAKQSSSAEVKNVAAKIKEAYASILPELDALAKELHVGEFERGVPTFEVPTSISGTDSTASFNDKAFLATVVEKQGEINGRFSREEHNTNTKVIHISEESLKKVEEIYTLAGGKSEGHGHH
ncbi:hypothetical protein ACR78Z_13780 [Sphingobacterium thalpophilum]|uniref:Predicted outer membrane protein n=1 Tax=Sphingobacterium thalpophilum TaxID=259 RepID=A0A4U9VNZ4_9SPHI|nr:MULTISPECIES: hypothetical protein [Sphingobacterium]MCW8309863.1 hypothetical protein [Sphingobacterium sp. InxBP1]VTR45161.1 Predicted outer membrane protein [Sphingobacterium thalpophilum]